MKLLKISDQTGQYLNSAGGYSPIDQLSKEDLLRLVNQTLGPEDIEFDAFDAATLKNHAHQIIYKSVLSKLTDLRERKDAFLDESARLFLAEYEQYRSDAAMGTDPLPA